MAFVNTADCYKVTSLVGKGHGMIATRKVFPGEVILSETPLIVVPNRIFRDFQKVETFIERRLNVMSCEDRDRFLSMADCCDGAGLGFCGRFYTNAMNYAGDACVCPDMAKANHSCRPNAGEYCTTVQPFLIHTIFQSL